VSASAGSANECRPNIVAEWLPGLSPGALFSCPCRRGARVSHL